MIVTYLAASFFIILGFPLAGGQHEGLREIWAKKTMFL